MPCLLRLRGLSLPEDAPPLAPRPPRMREEPRAGGQTVEVSKTMSMLSVSSPIFLLRERAPGIDPSPVSAQRCEATAVPPPPRAGADTRSP